VATPVTVFFDGQKREFVTESATVQEALNKEGIRISEFDLVEPARETILNGNFMIVTIKRARPIIIIDNGQEIKTQSPYDNVPDILNHSGIKIYPEDQVRLKVPLGRIDITPQIVIDRINPVTLEVDGQKLSFKTPAVKVIDLLKEKRVVLGPRDLVEPCSETFVKRGMTIKVIRISENTVIEQVDIPFEVEYIYDNTLPCSEEVVIQEGLLGKKEQIANIIYQNGWEKERVIIYEKILSLPRKAVIKKGTRQAYSGFATWYGPGFVGSNTASGELFNPAAFTAAHRTLPFGTLVKVTNVATGLSCVVRINDRGPYSYHIIDLTRAAADAIGMASVAPVILEVL